MAQAPEDAAAIARLCAGLPLALCTAAALLADTPTRPLSSLAQALRAEHSRLDRLRREDRAVRAAFELSHQHLDQDHARLFRLLPLNPGHDLATESAARLADVDVPQAEEMLQDLARSHLIEPGPVWGRWRLHDLVRLYADEAGHAYADPDQRDAARIRLLDFYEAFTWAANTHLDLQPGTRTHYFADRDGALSWLDAECDSLVAAVTMATAHGRHETSAALAVYLVEFLHFRRLFDSSITISTVAMAACRVLGDHVGELTMLNNLGTALHQTRRFDEAIETLTRAAATARSLNDRHGEGIALTNLGNALHEVRRLEEAIDAHTRAAVFAGETGDLHLQATALNNLGLALRELRRFEEAIDAHTRAVDIADEIGDRRLEGMSLTKEAATAARQSGDRRRESAVLNELGGTLREVRRFTEAVDAYTRAVEIALELGDLHPAGLLQTNIVYAQALALGPQGRPPS
ncbi:hypothetical protein BM536_038600 [Streptomyces phaeoluteigriseus]|uniref:Tetratricopeptide repeat protein n=1 Tax=Streptomyces phaeoluteigriseus TaxID=114686 RepID=A0A1V6MH71_9ACTN|nr:tetratricopeptide repeat protein [Streptomyces phaeoluteigriseus]OQD51696.1 hypothetical protein BM536_038600 [Streptomyces phaeoluteigriseus]